MKIAFVQHTLPILAAYSIIDQSYSPAYKCREDQDGFMRNSKSYIFIRLHGEDIFLIRWVERKNYRLISF